MTYDRKDTWYRKAKQEGYRSRAAYKLLELHRRVRLFRRGARVVDLGCAPGGWLQVAADEVGPTGRVVGIDRLEMAGLPGAQITLFQADINDPGSFEKIQQALGGMADVVMSDMAPDTSGVGFADHCRSVELVRVAFGFAQKLLKPGGAFLAKVFEGEDLNPLVAEIKAVFGEVKRYKLETTRKGSRELYLVAHAKPKQRKEG